MSNNIHAVQWSTKQSFIPAKGYSERSLLSVYRAHIHRHNNLTSFLPLEQIYDQVLKEQYYFLIDANRRHGSPHTPLRSSGWLFVGYFPSCFVMANMLRYGNMLVLAHKRWHVVMTSADHDVEPQTLTWSLKNEIKFFKKETHRCRCKISAF